VSALNSMERQEAAEVCGSLFDSWGESLVRYAFQLTWSRETAEDLGQEAFMALYADLRKGKKIENPKAWVLAIVRNLAHKRYRDRDRHGEVLEPTEVMDMRRAPSPPPEDLPDIKRMFSVLTPREAEVMRLRIQVLKYREIAEQLKISDKTVAKLLARALRKLQLAANRESNTGRRTVDVEETENV
jgi:RNA polymerase sigma factor (sigma-70 family)